MAFSLLIATILLPAVAVPQGAATLSGRALDDAGGGPVGLATVVVTRAESGDTLSATIAGRDGRFTVRGLAPGRYTIRTGFPGFSTAESSVLVSPLNASAPGGDGAPTRASG